MRLWDETQLRGTNDSRAGTALSTEKVAIKFWRRRILQASAWALIIGVLWTLDTLTKFQVRARAGFGPSNFDLIVEQATSGLGVLSMVVFVAWWLAHFPIRKSRPFSTLLGHIVGSVVFSLGHYGVMVLLRKVIYALNDSSYGWPASLLANLIFEYQKDIKIYLGILVVLTIYRQFLGGENRLQLRPATSKKILVQTGSGERILDYDQIEYLESSRNYVVVHAAGREYLVRQTMAGLLGKLTGGRFQRCHRSFAVNLDKVAELVAIDSGHTIRLVGGGLVPLSRKYRDEFKARLVD